MAEADFEPKLRLITAITNAINAAVTTSVAHGYTSGEVVYIIVTLTYGMHFRYVETAITVTGATTFTCDDVDTQGMDAFVAPGLVSFTPAQCGTVTQTVENVAV